MTTDDRAHDEDEDEYCYRHPKRETALSCISCERPICTECAIHGAVGIKCPQCAKQSRAARGQVPLPRLVRGVAAGSVTALVAGFVLDELRIIPLLGLILAYVAGLAVGAATRAGSGGFRDGLLVRYAAVAAAVGVLLPSILHLVEFGGQAFDIWALLLAVAAAFGAANRAGQ